MAVTKVFRNDSVGGLRLKVPDIDERQTQGNLTRENAHDLVNGIRALGKFNTINDATDTPCRATLSP